MKTAQYGVARGPFLGEILAVPSKINNAYFSTNNFW